MPICDGIEACKRIRLLEGKRKVPTSLPGTFLQRVCSVPRCFIFSFAVVVALTADCQESTKQLCLSAGMNAFFAKPLKRSEFTQRRERTDRSNCLPHRRSSATVIYVLTSIGIV